jgi:hypothetical protein
MIFIRDAFPKIIFELYLFLFHLSITITQGATLIYMPAEKFRLAQKGANE